MIERFHFPTKNGHKLWGCRAAPENPKATVIFCHGLPGGEPEYKTPSDDEGYPLLCRLFAERGYAAGHFSFSGCGESEGSLDLDQWIEDLLSAVDHFESEGFRAPMAVVGFSAGGATAIRAAALDDRIDPLILAASPANYAFLEAERNAAAYLEHYAAIGMVNDPNMTVEKFSDMFRKYDAEPAAKKVKAEKIAVIHGERDDVVPPSHAERLGELFGDRADVSMLPDVGHQMRIFPEALAEIAQYLDAWFPDGGDNS